MMDDITVAGGVTRGTDGTWETYCWFHGIQVEADAHRLSAWLAQLVQEHLHEIDAAEFSSLNGHTLQ